MNIKQKGFGAVELFLILVIVGVIGGLGWYLYQRRNDSSYSSANQTQNNSSQTSETTDCHTQNKSVGKTSGSGIEKYEWKTIENKTVWLSDWKVTFTLPDELVGKAVCRFVGSDYEFSTKAVITDDKCIDYYRGTELYMEGLQIARYHKNLDAEGLVGTGTKGSLENYYQTNKHDNNNYFTDPGAGRNFYKVGDYFYVAFGDAKATPANTVAARTAARKKACKNESPNFQQPFVDALASIKQS